jgi:hypothetical protein
MENFIDDYEAYIRLRPPCSCGCLSHCGHSCSSEYCDCTECSCKLCIEKDVQEK